MKPLRIHRTQVEHTLIYWHFKRLKWTLNVVGSKDNYVQLFGPNISPKSPLFSFEHFKDARVYIVHRNGGDNNQDDIINWKHFPRYWSFGRGIHQPPVNSPHKGQWCRALIFSLICAWKNVCINNRDAGDMRHHCAHYDVIVMQIPDLRGRGRGRDKLDAILQSFSTAFSCMKGIVFWLKFHWIFSQGFT